MLSAIVVMLLSDTTNYNGALDPSNPSTILDKGTILEYPSEDEIPATVARLIKLGAAKILGDDPAPAADPVSTGDDLLQTVLDQNAENTIKSITADQDPVVLQELLELETAGKNRKTVLAHIQALLTE